ncbi:MAG: CARDB domain-containing protein [Caldilineaceae bacterium]
MCGQTSFGESGRPITLSWRIDNLGAGSTNVTSWRDAVYISTDGVLNTGTDTRLGEWTHSGALSPSMAYTQTQTASLPNGIEGEYTLFLVTDRYAGVNDADRANNTLAASPRISVTLSTSPDALPSVG